MRSASRTCVRSAAWIAPGIEPARLSSWLHAAARDADTQAVSRDELVTRLQGDCIAVAARCEPGRDGVWLRLDDSSRDALLAAMEQPARCAGPAPARSGVAVGQPHAVRRGHPALVRACCRATQRRGAAADRSGHRLVGRPVRPRGRLSRCVAAGRCRRGVVADRCGDARGRARRRRLRRAAAPASRTAAPARPRARIPDLAQFQRDACADPARLASVPDRVHGISSPVATSGGCDARSSTRRTGRTRGCSACVRRSRAATSWWRAPARAVRFRRTGR